MHSTNGGNMPEHTEYEKNTLCISFCSLGLKNVEEAFYYTKLHTTKKIHIFFEYLICRIVFGEPF